MADPIKSALFVDYDSIHRRLKTISEEAAERLAGRAAGWVAAIESGRLVDAPREQDHRRILIRRCYADPELLGNNRNAFISSGFEIVDCPRHDGRDRNAADIHMVLDTIDALEHPTGYDEFILLAADADLTPVLLRLRAHNRTTVIYANEATGDNYKAIADAMIDEAALVQLLVADEQPAETEGGSTSEAAAAPDRSALEALARKIHAGTNVPLFSPRTYAELFRNIAEEVADRGYHFQKTAEHVTESLVGMGRNVNRRQVFFVVKGLALKGHVFSTNDTPEQLAEVFREQVLYLAENANLDLDDEETVLLKSWIVGRAGPATGRATARRPSDAGKSAPQQRPPPKPTPRPGVTAPAREAAPSTAKAPPPRNGADRPNAANDSAATKAEPKSAFTDEDIVTAKAAPAPEQSGAGVAAKAAPGRLEELRAAAAARLAAIGKPLGTLRSGTATKRSRREDAESPEPKVAKPAEPPPDGKEELESSILAAIAQAVDVLVEDGDGPDTAPAEKENAARAKDDKDEKRPADDPAPPAAAEPAEPVPDPAPSEGGDSDDIGDEIQRIIASYSRARQQGGPT